MSFLTLYISTNFTLSFPPNQVKVWFQNRRTKQKKDSEKLEPQPPTSSAPALPDSSNAAWRLLKMIESSSSYLNATPSSASGVSQSMPSSTSTTSTLPGMTASLSHCGIGGGVFPPPPYFSNTTTYPAPLLSGGEEVPYSATAHPHHSPRPATTAAPGSPNPALTPPGLLATVPAYPVPRLPISHAEVPAVSAYPRLPISPSEIPPTSAYPRLPISPSEMPPSSFPSSHSYFGHLSDPSLRSAYLYGSAGLSPLRQASSLELDAAHSIPKRSPAPEASSTCASNDACGVPAVPSSVPQVAPHHLQFWSTIYGSAQGWPRSSSSHFSSSSPPSFPQLCQPLHRPSGVVIPNLPNGMNPFY